MIYKEKPLKEGDGVKIFSTKDFYWYKDISREQIRSLQRELNKFPIEVSASNVGIKSGYGVDYQRGDIIYFFPYKNTPDFKVLDLGSGFGNITIPLAKKMPNAQIFAVDGSLDLLKVLYKQSIWEKCSNIETIKVDAFENMNLPFNEKSFDLIIMNGVLEWIGAGISSGSPHDHQIVFLNYIKKFLKDDGALYIGIEGRFFPGYFTGIKDPHSGLKFTSIMPRFLANWWCKYRGMANGYRTYTYSYPGYCKLFRAAGFNPKKIEPIYPVASYKDPFFMFSYLNKSAYSYAFKNLINKIFPTPRSSWLYSILYILGLEKFFAASYLFLLRNGDRTELLIDAYIKKYLDNKEYEPIKVFGNLDNNGFVNFLLVDKKDSQPHYFLKIKRFLREGDDIIKRAEKLSKFKITSAILSIKYDSESELFEFNSSKPIQFNEHSIKRAIELIKEIHINNEIESGRGLIHGDYTLDNILDTKDGWKVIDWAEFEENQNQIFDICNLLLHYYSIYLGFQNKDLIKKMTGNESYLFFSHYDKNIEIKSLSAIWQAFLKYNCEKFANRKRRRLVYYQELQKYFL